MPFNDSVAAEVLGKCGRVCCICRRHKPIRLQVHHIVEESKGGLNTVENAIPTCLTCHIDVHSKIPFARRFTKEELLFRRDETFRLVSDGKLVPPDDDYVPAYISVANSQKSTLGDRQITIEAAELLVAAAESKYGWLTFIADKGGCSISAGDLQKDIDDGRNRALYEAAIEELASLKLIKKDRSRQSITLWQVTHFGYLSADELAVLAF